ncbi:MAG TPA: lytic transglycosylase domain-containing protein [Thermoanaerobaculia bacterium]|nr:lytic transglycosylase domain-containing protein [Thermoanaerobaculia bacterium]
MKAMVVMLLLAAAATTLRADGAPHPQPLSPPGGERVAGGRFVASDVPAAGMRKPGKIVISNQGNVITAFRFFGDIREALFSLRSKRTLATRAYGPVLFDSGARLDAAVPAYLSAVIADAAKTNGVDPRLVAAVARRESALNPSAVSAVGACGLMQLMPATARYLGVTNVFDARENVHGGTRYLRTLLDTFDGDLDLALAAYNAGPGAVQRYGGVPPYAETRAYVRAVRASYERSLQAR